MKKTWIIVLIVAVVALIAIIAYNSESNVSDTNQAPNTASGSENVAQSGSQTDDDEREEEDEFEDDVNNASATGTIANNTNTNITITLSELSTHDTKNDCWIAYKGKVYDITKFLPVHPGSSAAIEPYCGTNGEFEKAFMSQHGTSKVSELQKRGIFKGNLA